jgi:hypothetical protein
MANSLLCKASVPFSPLSEADRACAAAGQSRAAAQKLHDNDAPQVKVGTAAISRGMKHCDSNEFPVGGTKGRPTFVSSSICHRMAIRAAQPMQRLRRPTLHQSSVATLPAQVQLAQPPIVQERPSKVIRSLIRGIEPYLGQVPRGFRKIEIRKENHKMVPLHYNATAITSFGVGKLPLCATGSIKSSDP